MSRVWEISGQSGGALIVLLAIADFADDAGIAFPSIGTLARKARLSPRQVQRVVAALVAEGELWIEPGRGRQGSHLYRVVVGTPRQNVTPDTMSPRQNVTPDKMPPAGRRPRRKGVTPVTQAGVTPVSYKPSYREPSGTDTPLPPAWQQQGESEGEEESPSTLDALSQIPNDRLSAPMLVVGLYNGLGLDVDQLTPTMRARELVIAQELVGVGATPSEAEAYAREESTRSGRMAPVDMRSFERERLSWLAKRRVISRTFGGLRLVTGQGLSD